MKKRILILCVVSLSTMSCQRGCSKINRQFETTERNYEITMYSGGAIVFQDKFRGIINNSEASDGCYYYKNDSLIEVSGDYIIKSN